MCLVEAAVFSKTIPLFIADLGLSQNSRQKFPSDVTFMRIRYSQRNITFRHESMTAASKWTLKAKYFKVLDKVPS